MPDMLHELRPSIIPPEREAVETGADTKSSLTTHQQGEEQFREQWDLIDLKLIEWGCNLSRFDEEGIVPPSRQAIRRAIEVAQELSNALAPAPMRVVPDAYGGIVFERRDRDLFETIRIGADECVEHCAFCNWELVMRESW